MGNFLSIESVCGDRKTNIVKMSNDTGNDIDNQLDEEDRPFLRDRVYYAAKDGLPIAMYALLNNVKDDETKNAIINQVRYYYSTIG